MIYIQGNSSVFADLTGHNSIMFSEVPHYKGLFIWNNMHNNGLTQSSMARPYSSCRSIITYSTQAIILLRDPFRVWPSLTLPDAEELLQAIMPLHGLRFGHARIAMSRVPSFMMLTAYKSSGLPLSSYTKGSRLFLASK